MSALRKSGPSGCCSSRTIHYIRDSPYNPQPAPSPPPSWLSSLLPPHSIVAFWNSDSRERLRHLTAHSTPPASSPPRVLRRRRQQKTKIGGPGRKEKKKHEAALFHPEPASVPRPSVLQCC